MPHGQPGRGLRPSSGPSGRTASAKGKADTWADRHSRIADAGEGWDAPPAMSGAPALAMPREEASRLHFKDRLE